MKKYHQEFSSGIVKDFDSFPDHYVQAINNQTYKIMVAAFTDDEGNKVDNDLALGSVQRSLSLLIINFFPEESLLEVSKGVCEAIMRSVNGMKPLEEE